MTKIGIVGTGILGEAVGLHLLDVGYEVTVFNRTKNKTEKLEKKGARVAIVKKKSNKINKPIFLHVITKKGYGYKPAEESIDKFHGVNKFDVITGSSLSKSNH